LRGNEIPYLNGMAQDCYTVIGWLGRLEVLFSAKGVVEDAERIKAAGVGITDLQWGEWYRMTHQELQKLTWADFCDHVKDQFLLPNWESEVLCDIRTLKMGDRESFEKFSYWVLRLQSVVKHKLGDEQLAVHIMAGLPRALELDIRDTGIMDADPLQLTTTQSTSLATRNMGQASQVPRIPLPAMSETERRNFNIWHFKCYFAEQGLCHWCKTKCGAEPTKCQKPRSSVIIRCPWEYKPPPMP
ncbi:hypothetical protein CROQUDRAFT_21186, partial [Cronartium quercuum f. sp. fusiforme G11]